MRVVCLVLAAAIVLVGGCKSNKIPSVPELTGSFVAVAGETARVTVMATDPEGKEVSYKASWGDVSPIEWTPNYGSGLALTLTHVYADSGAFKFKVKSRDEAESESDWSEEQSVRVGPLGDSAPGAPLIAGPSVVDVEEAASFAFTSRDPEGHRVAYFVDWGDGDTSTWSAQQASGAEWSAFHTYSDSGVCSLQARAKDEYGKVSSWSVPHVVAVGGVQSLPAPSVTYAAINFGDELWLTWSPVAGAEGYKVQTDDYTYTTGATTYGLTTPTKAVAVYAYCGAADGEKWTLVTTPVITLALEVYGNSDPSPDHPAAFGFTTDGTAIAYALAQPSNYPMIDFVMDDLAQGSMYFYSPNRYNPVFNDKDNAVAEASGSNFDAATIATGDFFTAFGCVPGVLYYFWLDPNANGWDATVDHFGKMKVLSVVGTKVTLKLAYQMVPGLTWVRTN